VDTGEWIVPHLNSEVYPDKPPLFFWLIAFFSFFTGGVTGVSARLPSALASVVCVLLTYFLGKRLFNDRAGLIAGLVLVTSSQFFWLGRRANIDMTLTMFILFALTFFYLGLQEEKKSQGFYLVSFLFMGLGVLAKGPVGFLLPALTIISFLAVTKNLKHLKKIETLWGMILFTALILAWLVPACIQGGEAYTSEILFTQNIDRFVNVSAFGHQRPFYYYFYTFPSGFSPWIFILPGAFLWGYKNSQRKNRSIFYFPFCWFITIFLFFSLSTSKRELYLLPLYPAASILIGGFLSYFISKDNRIDLPFKFLVVPFYLMGGAFIAGGIFLCAFPYIETPVSGFLHFFPHIVPLSFIFISGGSLVLFFTRKKNLFVTFITVTILMLASFLVSIEVVFPKMNLIKSAKPMSQRIVSHLSEGKELVSYRIKAAPFNFYTGLNKIKEISTIEELKNYLDSHSTGLVLLKEKIFKRLQDNSLIPRDIHILEKDQIGHRTFILFLKR
jgi:4-amino-4-deoxy-L-arabinose transferase-like glycosyltransferase